MTSFRIALCCACSLLLPQAAFADENTAAAIADARLEVNLEDGRLSGEGARFLVARAADVDYLLFGEQHATADIADFATAYILALAEHGYRRAAIEVGPWSTRRLEQWLRAGMPAYAAFLAQDTNLLSVPFYFFREEAAFLQAVLAAAGDSRPALLGLDQEFIASAPVVLPLLAGLAGSDAERAAIDAALAAAQHNPMFIGAAAEAELEALARAFAGSDSAEARELAHALLLSNRIYSPFVKRDGALSVLEANTLRENYMKRLYLQYRQAAAPAADRIFFKFGANHLARGVSPTHVLSLGNFVTEYGLSENRSAWAVHVDCLGGEMRDVQTGGTKPCPSYYLDDDSVLLEHLGPDKITLIDLRRLRGTRIARGFDEATRRLIDAYDAYVVIRDVAPATFFPGRLPAFD